MKAEEKKGRREKKKMGEKENRKERAKKRTDGCIDWLSHSRGAEIIERMFLLGFGKTLA